MQSGARSVFQNLTRFREPDETFESFSEAQIRSRPSAARSQVSSVFGRVFNVQSCRTLAVFSAGVLSNEAGELMMWQGEYAVSAPARMRGMCA